MPLKALQFKPGVNKERTSTANEGTWIDADKVRFRQGLPEKIGGWARISSATFLGVCRSLWSWITLESVQYTGVGTHLKFYVERGGAYYDITPLRATESLTDPFETTTGSAVVTVTDANGGFSNNDYVTFSGASAVGGITIDGEYQITLVDGTSYQITHTSTASSDATGGGSVSAAYQLNTGAEIAVPANGWGASTFGSGPWGQGATASVLSDLRLWSQFNFGEDLIFGPREGKIYYWDGANPTSTRAVELSTLGGASDTPVIQNYILVSDIYRFVFALGTNPIGSSTQDPMLIRWTDIESAVNWTPAADSQAGSVRLSRGTEIVTALITRQENLIWTDSALYSMQYADVPVVWSTQLVGSNLSIASPRAAIHISGRTYWMGKDKFFVYDGVIKTLRCDVRRHVFSDIERDQQSQVFAGTNEGFNEVWWFYCSSGSDTVDRYVVYNYVEDIWYNGMLDRTAWLDTGIKEFPLAATYSNNLVNHESGIDDDETGTPAAISAYIESGDTDLEDGDRFMFIRRVLPDITFDGSTAESPAVTFTLSPSKSPGSGYNSPKSEGGNSSASTTRTASSPVEVYTETLYLRVRGRQVRLKVDSSALGVHWQLGLPRVDMRPDGRRG